MELELDALPPFNLQAVIRSHGWVSLDPFVTAEPFREMSFVHELSSGRVVAAEVTPRKHGVRVAAPGRWRAAERDELAEKVARMVGLHVNLQPFYKLARQEPRLSHVKRRGQGRWLRSPTLFEDVVKTILTTNTTWAGTKRMNQRLVQTFGAALPRDDQRRAFPTPQRLARANEKKLRDEIKLGYRAPYVIELARQVSRGRLDLDELFAAELTTSELRKKLLAIKGVGPYAAANLLMLLGRYDYLPVDSWAIKLVSKQLGRRAKPADVEKMFAPWDEWKALAYWFWDWDR